MPQSGSMQQDLYAKQVEHQQHECKQQFAGLSGFFEKYQEGDQESLYDANKQEYFKKRKAVVQKVHL